ncbi:porin [Pedobacter chitinilyticus]|uniref:Porin n=2 Tax=Pedobacter chitinilyticus TaxID=2233776 RepID=A0A443YMU3_9SPHI|nr:porin [Pedobacter chitinilyticus]RWU05048.1 porin [Pedobacter chitinilyticus]
MMKKKCLLFSFLLIFSLSAIAQQTDIAGIDRDTITNYSTYKRSIGFAGLLQTRFLASLSDKVDINGKHFNDASTSKNTNAFLLKRVRLQVKGNVNDHFAANIMFNFAEFSSNPANKVLENAYVKYTLSKHFQVQAGQFRPFFGIEDALPVDVIRTFDYSNQYYAFGASGWQSFQIGLSLFGDVTSTGQMPIRYYLGVYNGNNRNESSDNDDAKNFYGRIEAEVAKKLIVGVNAAVGSMGNGQGDAWGADVVTTHKLGNRWQFSLSGEYKNGSNLSLFNTFTTNAPSLSKVRMHGFYVFPILRYNCNLPRLRGIEFSSRYEYLDLNYKLDKNVRRNIVPNISLVFADDFYAAIQTGVSLNLYDRNVPLSTTYDSHLYYLQLQVRF